MGYTTAAGIAEATQSMGLSIDLALEMHLTSNHFPAIPTAWIAPAKAAIDWCNDGEPSYDIDINAVVAQTGMSPRDAHPVTGDDGAQRIHIAAGDLVTRLHLEAFLVDPEGAFDDGDFDETDEVIE